VEQLIWAGAVVYGDVMSRCTCGRTLASRSSFEERPVTVLVLIWGLRGTSGVRGGGHWLAFAFLGVLGFWTSSHVSGPQVSSTVHSRNQPSLSGTRMHVNASGKTRWWVEM
jgi:hypothetical protein